MVREVLQPKQFDYISLDGAETVHEIPFDKTGTIQVLGDDAGYEWIIWNNGRLVAHSNYGYGQPAAALRDGLNKALPD